MSLLLEVNHVSKSFTIHHLNKTIQAIKDIHFSLNKGDFIGIIGKSGSGKSTILKLIYRTYLPGEGEIMYHSDKYGKIDLLQATEQEMIDLRKFEIGYVSQFLNVMPRMTARKIVEQSVLEMGKTKVEAEIIAAQALKQFDLDESIWDNYPVTFSGGEKLRLNIARAIVKKPRLLLLDEPTASLDQESKLKVRKAIEQLKAEGTTLIGIFHDLEFMDGLCDYVYDFQKEVVR